MGPFDEHINMHREVGQVDLMVCALEQSMIIESYNMDFRKYAKQTEYYMKNMSGEIITEALVDVGKKFMEMLEKLRKAIINFCIRAKDRIYQCVNGYRAFANNFNDNMLDNLKYDTDKMELISDKCEYTYTWTLTLINTEMRSSGKDVKLWKSKKGNWLLTYRTDYSSRAVKLLEEEVKKLLLKYDLQKYEELFGELEEA